MNEMSNGRKFPAMEAGSPVQETESPQIKRALNSLFDKLDRLEKLIIAHSERIGPVLRREETTCGPCKEVPKNSQTAPLANEIYAAADRVENICEFVSDFGRRVEL